MQDVDRSTIVVGVDIAGFCERITKGECNQSLDWRKEKPHSLYQEMVTLKRNCWRDREISLISCD